MTISAKTKHLLIALSCLIGVALLAGCSNEEPKTEATPAGATAVSSGAGPQRQTLNSNGPSAAPGAGNSSLRSLRSK